MTPTKPGGAWLSGIVVGLGITTGVLRGVTPGVKA